MAITEQEAIRLADDQMKESKTDYHLSSIERQIRHNRDTWFIAFEGIGMPDELLMDGAVTFFEVDVETGKVTMLPQP